MLRWVLAVVSLQLACLSQGTRTEVGDTHADAEVLQEIGEPVETSGPDADPEAHTAQPCIAITPTLISFGASEIGTSSTMTLSILSCGDAPLVIDAISITNDGDGVFAIEGAVGRTTLEAGATMSVAVSFTPKMSATFDAAGNVVQTKGALSIDSNAPEGAVTVPLEGFGSHFECPVAVITVAEGDEVVPGTNLSLSGASSVSSVGIESYAWSVVQPDGSVSTFFPSSSVVSPRFEVNVVGRYIFRLLVRDRFATASCAPAEYTVIVGGDKSIMVEVLWDTPGDPDQHDISDPFDMYSAGSDVDLHFLHPSANGQLLDNRYDCYFANPSPNWGGPGNDDDPRLERDDSDGAGPEYLTLPNPEEGARYQVSVHYYDDWGYGDSEVTIRIYISGNLRDEWSATLSKDDQWDAQYIDWPSGLVTRIGEGAPRITPDVRAN